MRISSIALRHFRSAKGLVLDTDAPRVYICGRNGVGKTTVKQAARWALRGVTEDTDARGLGWEMLQPVGTNAVAVGLTFGSGFTVERGYQGKNKELLVNNNPAEISVSQTAIYERLQVPPAFIDAVLETSYFVDLSHADAKAFVLSLLDVKIPVPRADGTQELLSLDQVQARYKVEFDRRTQAKANLRAHQIPSFTPQDDMPETADVVALLEKRRAELKTLVEASGNVAGQREALAQELQRAEQVPWRPAGVAVPTEDEIARLKAIVDEAEQMLEAAVTELAKRPEAPKRAKRGEEPQLIPVQTLEAVMEALTAHKPLQGCVMDGNVPCETSKIKFTHRVKAIRADLDSREQTEAPAAADVDPLQDTREAIDAARQKYVRAVKVAEDAAAATAANTLRQETIDGIRARQAALQDDPEAQAAIADLETRIRKGEMIEARAREYWKAKKAHGDALATQERLKADVDRLEAMVELLGPKGAMVPALSKAIGEFEDRINATTETLGWKIRFDLDPWRVWVNQRPLESYSESQRFRIGVAVQLAVAALSGLGFVVVDRLDMLDTINRAEMTKLLLAAEAIDVQQVIIIATRDEDQTLPAVPDMKAYRLGLNDASETVVLEGIA